MRNSAEQRYDPSPEVVFNRAGDEAVIIHLVTNAIYDLNGTSARCWELLSAGQDRASIQRTMLAEYDVSEAELSAEIDALIEKLEREQLILRRDS